MNTKQSRASIYMAFGMLAMGNSGHVAAQEDTSATTAPHTFESGDVISAEQMNNNFSAIFDAIAEIKAASGTQGDVGPAGPAGPAGPEGPAGIAIKDAGTFAGSVETASFGGNFSLLPGAGGATGIAAADAACEVNYPGSHAEMDTLALWQSGVDGELAIGRYWSSTETDVPVKDYQEITTNCDDWTSNNNDSTSSERDSGNFVNVDLGDSPTSTSTSTPTSTSTSTSKFVSFGAYECRVPAFRTMKIACYNN